MFMIRKPIPRVVAVALGVVSIFSLIGFYSWLANSRAAIKRESAAQQLQQAQSELSATTAALAVNEDDADLQKKLARLKAQTANLLDESTSAVDRTMPTLSSLYHDGLLRVLKPQGLNKDEYWLAEDARSSAYRLVAGLLVGVLLSMVLGILMGSYTWLEAFFLPPLSFLAKIPPTAMLAVFFVLVGTDFKMYVSMIAFGTLPTLAQSIYQSAKKDVPESLVYKAYTLGAGHGELIWNVIYKQILPRIIDAIRLQIGPAMVLLVAAEWMVAGEGFGYRLRLFYQRTDMTVVYVYLILLGAAGLAADYFLTWLRRTLCPWFGE